MPETHTREAAWELLTGFTQSESLRKHALAVEACMRACSRKFGNGSAEDENLWPRTVLYPYFAEIGSYGHVRRTGGGRRYHSIIC